MSTRAKVMSKRDRHDWLFKRLAQERVGTDILDRDFVEDYAAETGARYIHAPWGAGWCALLSRDLYAMYRCGWLRRSRTGLSGGSWQPGFPKWVYTYRADRNEITDHVFKMSEAKP